MAKQASPVIHENIAKWPISKIKPYPGNAKAHKKKDIQLLADHIAEAGWDQPIVVVGETGEIIKGHKRYAAAKLLKLKEVPVIAHHGLSELEIEERRLADNKLAESQWDNSKLKESIAKVMAQGSNISRLGFADMAKSLRAKSERPEVEFSQVMSEANNYIVLTFDNEVDWLAAQTHFQLETVTSKRANGKPWSRGIGRVLNGASYLKRIKEGN